MLKNRVILSPMEAVSDAGFRQLCHKLGADFTWTEMVRAQGIIKENPATLDLIDTFDHNTPVGLQLLVRTANDLEVCLAKVEQLSKIMKYSHFENIRAIDLNFGCPSPAVIKEGAGPSLLKRRTKLVEIFTALKLWQENSSMPHIQAVGCKIRLGLNELEQERKVYLPVIQAANDCGLDYVVVHARHAKQRSRDLPTWAAIGEAKSIAQMPIIGNGNVVTAADAQQLIAQSGCDAVMVARGAIRNPWSLMDFATNDITSSTASIGHTTWPTLDQVRSAQAQYESWASHCKTKAKFTQYHAKNFERLKNVAKSSNSPSDTPFSVPFNAHMF